MTFEKVSFLMDHRQIARRRSTDLRRIHNYLVGDRIANGTFASIRLALKRNSRDEIVAKIIMKERMNSSGENGEVMFSSELYLAPMLIHANVLRTREVVETKGSIIQVYDRCRNGDLAEYLDTHTGLTQEALLKITYQIISAVEYLHGFELCHRDIKMENCLIDSNGNVKLCDFGFVAYGYNCHGKLGSPGYAAPEVFSGEEYNGMKVDIWSIGVLVYCIFGGETANPEDVQIEILPAKIRELVSACLRENPDERPLIEHLKRFSCFDGLDEGVVVKKPDLEAPITSFQPEVVRRLSEIYQMETNEIEEWLERDSRNEMKSVYYIACDYFAAPECAEENVDLYPNSGFTQPYDREESHVIQGTCLRVTESIVEFLLSQNYCISTNRDGSKTAILNLHTGDIGFDFTVTESGVSESTVHFKSNEMAKPGTNILIEVLRSTYL